jgi:hypothetical protein
LHGSNSPNSAPSTFLSVWAERSIFDILVLLKLVVLFTQWGKVPGFDAGDFFHRVELMNKGVYAPGFQECFWAYHPPLGFFFVHLLSRITGDVGNATQLANTTAMLVAMAAFRGALAHLGMHRSVFGIVTLTVASSLPVIIHGAVSAHLDTFIYALNAVVLYVSIRTFGREKTWRPGLLLIPMLIATGMLVKFSGLLACFIPLGIAAIFKRSLKDSWLALVVAMAGLVMVAPYYHDRYFVPTGAVFPSANDWWYPNELAAAKSARDADRLGWLLSLVAPSPVEDPNAHCLTAIHLSDAWRDLWIRDRQLGASSEPVLRLGILYFNTGIVIVAAGAIALLSRFRKGETTGKLGVFGAGIAALQVGALASYSWTQCIPDQTNAKALYILPAVWFFAFSAAALCEIPQSKAGRMVAIAACLAFAMVNHTVPIY